MKIKTILVCIILTVSIFLIYLTNIDKKIYYVSINDYKKDSLKKYDEFLLKSINNLEIFINEFSNENLRLTDVINNIEKNVEIKKGNKKISIKHALIKADILTLSLGNNELLYKIKTQSNNLYDTIDQIIDDYDNLLNVIRTYCKEKIFVIGINYKTEDEKIINVIKYYNKKLKDLSKSYNINFIDITINDEVKQNEEIAQNINKILKNNN
ncbi:MAG: SGNH/GDSL hydrolase family protein [Bacilli bacterium]|nr:SGNH/GDSL hydrolase family protein [Bacilli bacterium]